MYIQGEENGLEALVSTGIVQRFILLIKCYEKQNGFSLPYPTTDILPTGGASPHTLLLSDCRLRPPLPAHGADSERSTGLFPSPSSGPYGGLPHTQTAV